MPEPGWEHFYRDPAPRRTTERNRARHRATERDQVRRRTTRLDQVRRTATDLVPAPPLRSALRRLTDGFPALYRADTHEFPELDPETGPFLGPPTSAQMMALRQLSYIAEVQQSALDTALVPVRQGGRGAIAALWGARKRLLTFAANGLAVFAFGVAVQYALIHGLGMSHVESYVIQTVLSVQVNFLLSRYLTWRDRRVGAASALVRFNIQQLASTGIGMALYAGLEHFGMNYIAANVAVTAVLTPVSFVIGHHWSMADRAASLRLRDVPWPLLGVLAVQVLLSMRLIWSNTAFIDEATYLYVGNQDFSHWIHGVPIRDYQTFLSGAPVVYPPIAAIVNAVGGLVAARFLSLAFMVGATCLLYVTAARLFDKWMALVAAALFAGLAGTQFLGALATYDAMALFLLVLSAYLLVGRKNAYDTLTDIACSTVIAGGVLALANADKYATALWDPVVIGVACCAPPMAGYSWRYGIGRAVRFAVTLGAFLAVGLVIGKAKYVQGILYTTVNRSSSQVGMGQPATLVLRDAWHWVGLVIALALVGAVLLLWPGRRFPSARRGALPLLGALLVLAVVAAPLNQARIGTTVSLHKHVVFGAWFGCILAGYAITRVLRWRVLIGACACALLVPLAAQDAVTAQGYYQWPTENMAFITDLRTYVHPGDQKYLISGYDDIPGYYVNYVSSIQWKEAGTYSYVDPQTGRFLLNGPAFDDAIKHRVFQLIILDFKGSNGPNEPGNDYLIQAAIARYGNYRVVGHLPPSDSSSNNYYTVWRVTGSN